MDWIGIVIVIILVIICVLLTLGGVTFLCGFELILKCFDPEIAKQAILLL